MRRTALTLIALCSLSACTDQATTSPLSGTVPATAPAFRQSVQGVLRLADQGWMLEASDGSTVWLIGGPVDTYSALEGREIVAVGVYQNGSLYVDYCTLIVPLFNRT